MLHHSGMSVFSQLKTMFRNRYTILFITNVYQYQGGGGHFAYLLTSALQKEGHHVDIFQTGWNTNSVTHLSSPDTMAYPLDGEQSFFEIQKKLQKQYDIIHLNGFAPTITLCTSGWFNFLKKQYPSAKIINTIHSWNDHPSIKQPNDALLLDLFHAVDVSVHVCKNMYLQCHGHRGEYQLFSSSRYYSRMGFAAGVRHKATWVYNGVPNAIKKGPLNIEKKIGSGKPLIFTFLGRLCSQKNVCSLAEAFISLYQKNPRCHLWIIGGGPDEQRMRKKLSILPSSSYTFWGWQFDEKKDELLDASDILIVPSDYEPFCLAALEGFAHNLPLVISCIDGPKELFIGNAIKKNSEGLYDGYSAIGIDPYDTRGLSAAYTYVTNHSHLSSLIQKVRRGQNQLCVDFSLKKMIDQYLSLYRALSQGKEFRPDELVHNTAGDVLLSLGGVPIPDIPAQDA